MSTNGTAPLDGRAPTPTNAVVSAKLATAQMRTIHTGLLQLSYLAIVAMAASTS